MNIHYRIVNVDPAAHGILIRYFTDKVTEMDLANSFNEDGSIRLNADGYPLSTRTDVFMSVYDTPTPSQEEIERRIMVNAPVDWLKLQEDIVDPNVDTKMKTLRDLTGESNSFTIDDVTRIRGEIRAAQVQAAKEAAVDDLQGAYDLVINLRDSLKVLAEKDPSIVEEFFKDFESLKPPQK